MKSTGVVRKMDDLGRIVIPIELRRSMNIHIGDPIEIFTDDGLIVLSPCKQLCICCGATDHLKEVNEVRLCTDCIKKFGGLSHENTPHC
jgi:AbrB family transcriptional regulator, transcriptional pleiotropic regulator of transition state genes